MVDWSKLADGNTGFNNQDLTARSRCFLFTGVLIAFASFAGSIWLMIEKYATRTDGGSSWPGIALIISNFLILLSAVVMRLGRASTVAYSGL